MRSSFAACLLFAAFLPPATLLAQDSLWASYAKSGAEALNKNEHKEAAKLLERAVAEIDQGRVRNAAAVEARTNLGEAYRKLSRFADAVKAHETACEVAREVLAPNDPVGLLAAYRLNLAYIARGQDANARLFMEWLAKRLKEDANARAYLKLNVLLDELASLYIRAKEYDLADKAYQDAGAFEAALDPDHLRDGNRLWNRALLENKRERPTAAAKLFLQAAAKYASNTDTKLANNRDDVLSFQEAAKAFAAAKDADRERDSLERAENRLTEVRKHWDGSAGPASAEATGAWVHLADFYEEGKRFADAETTLKSLHRVVAEKKGVGSAEAVGEEMRVAAFHQRRKNPAEAEKWFRSALGNREAKAGKDSPDLAACLNRLAGFLSDNGKHEEAEKLLRRNLANCRAGGEAARRATAEACDKLADHLHHHAAGKECFTLLKESLGIYEKLDGESSRKVADALDNMAWKADEREARLPLARRARQIIEATGYRDWRYEKALNTLGMALNANAQNEEAEKCYRECLALELDRAPDKPTSAHLHNNIAHSLERRDRFVDAEPEYQKACERGQQQGKDIYSIAKSHANFAGLYFRWHKSAEAEKHARKALELREGDSGKESTVLATSLGQMAAIEARRGQFAVAEGLLDRSAKIRERYFKDDEHQAKIANLFEAAWRHRHHGRFAEAESSLAELFKLAERFRRDDSLDGIFSSITGPYWSWMHDAWELRGRVALDRGDFTLAEEHLRQALATHEKYHTGTSRHAGVLLLLG